MRTSPTRLYTALAGTFLLLQGVSTLTFRLVPALDAAFPPLLAISHMMPAHSSLHIVSGLLALWALWRGGERGALVFSAGFGAFYVGLALFGARVGHPTVLELQPFDHIFHLFLGGVGLLAAGLSLHRARRSRRAQR